MAEATVAQTTRCRMVCQLVRQPWPGMATTEVVLTPVYDPDPAGVNHAFWRATPNGAFTAYIDNPEGASIFHVGQVYDLDITRVDAGWREPGIPGLPVGG